MTETAHPSILVLEQTFACTATKIWDFWTVPELMQLWFGSDPNGTVSAASADLKVDGSFSVTFVNSNGTEHTCSGRYLTIEPFSTLSFTWYWKGREKHIEVVSVVLSEMDQGVRMTFTHQDIDPATSHDYRLGWTSTFEKLRKVLLRSSQSS